MHIKLNIDKRDTQIFKGMAIIMITLHNLIHKLPNMPIENEFKFHNYGSDIFFSPLFFENPVSFVFSFFGYYGVQIFIFLSAYAFYLKKDEILDIPYLSFIKKRYLRLSYPLLLSMVLVSFLDTIYKIIFFNYPYETLLHNFLGYYVGGLLHLTSLHPFLPHGLPGGLGPWWFISFILQAYFIYPVLFKINFKKRFYFIISFITSYILIFSLNLWLPEINFNYTVIGHLPEILLGIYFAEYLNNKSVKLYIVAGVMFTGLLLLLYSNIYKSLWPFSFSFATVSLISLFFIYRSFMTNLQRTIFIFIGNISIYIFLINGATRSPFIYFINSYSDNAMMYWLNIVSYLLITIFLAYLLTKMETYIREHISISNIPAFLKKR
jgi:peptidoglycan/LPS O-acetylase OafA/YrhL